MPLSRIFKRCMNQYSTDPPRHRFSLRTMFAVVAAIAVGLLPIASFGWKGIISAICLVIAGLLIVIGKRGLAVTLFILLLLGQFFYPAIDGAREAILRTDCQDNIRKLTIAIHEYESKHGQIPPPYSIAADGTPLHSWRVLLLPFLGEQSLYDEIDLDKPWGDPVNIQFHSRMPDVFCCAAIKYHSKWGSTGNSTAYLVIVDDHSVAYKQSSIAYTDIQRRWCVDDDRDCRIRKSSNSMDVYVRSRLGNILGQPGFFATTQRFVELFPVRFINKHIVRQSRT